MWPHLCLCQGYCHAMLDFVLQCLETGLRFHCVCVFFRRLHAGSNRGRTGDDVWRQPHWSLPVNQFVAGPSEAE